MSLSSFLRSGQRVILSFLPEIRALGCGTLATSKKFHSACKNDLTTAPQLLKITKASLYDAVRGMKTKGKLNLRCKDCYFLTKDGRRYVLCKTHGRHKQQLIVPKEKDTWIYTHVMTNRIRPY